MPQFWAGFVDGKLDRREVDDGHGGFGCTHHNAPALYLSRELALTRYHDVRKVEVRVVSKPKKK